LDHASLLKDWIP